MEHRTILALDSVGVRYKRPLSRKEFWALQNVSMTVQSGETIGVIGRNGAGKSTLLKVLSGIIEPDKGTVERAPGRVSLLSLQVGFLGHLSGIENAILSGLLRGLSRAEMDAKLEQILEFAELGEYAKEPIFTYSSGMKARLGFAVAYHSAPQVLLIDEVLGVGDLDFREKSSNAIRELMDSDRTVVVVSHQPSTMSRLCSRVVWIEDGITRAEGPTKEVLREYQDFIKHRKEILAKTAI